MRISFFLAAALIYPMNVESQEISGTYFAFHFKCLLEKQNFYLSLPDSLFLIDLRNCDSLTETAMREPNVNGSVSSVHIEPYDSWEQYDIVVVDPDSPALDLAVTAIKERIEAGSLEWAIRSPSGIVAPLDKSSVSLLQVDDIKASVTAGRYVVSVDDDRPFGSVTIESKRFDKPSDLYIERRDVAWNRSYFNDADLFLGDTIYPPIQSNETIAYLPTIKPSRDPRQPAYTITLFRNELECLSILNNKETINLLNSSELVFLRGSSYCDIRLSFD